MFTMLTITSIIVFTCLCHRAITAPVKDLLDEVLVVSQQVDQDDQCQPRLYQPTDAEIDQDYRELSTSISYAKNVLAEITGKWEMFQELEKNTINLEKLDGMKVPDWLPDISEKTDQAITLRDALHNANKYFQKTKIILNRVSGDESFSMAVRRHFQTISQENEKILLKVQETMCLVHGTTRQLERADHPVVPEVDTQSELDYMTFLILHNYKEATIFLDILFRKFTR